MIRVVLDTNVLVSAFLKNNGTSYKIVEAAAKLEFRLIIGQAILREVNEALHYSHIQKRYKPTDGHIVAYIIHLATIAQITPGLLKIEVIGEDPKDDMILATAIEGRADYLVSGDSHLKNLHEYGSIKIVSPREFKEILDFRST